MCIRDRFASVSSHTVQSDMSTTKQSKTQSVSYTHLDVYKRQSDWMVARAAAATGDGELSLRFAERAHRAAQENAVPDWLVASTAEGVARAFAVTGDVEAFNNWSALAARLIEVIADPEDKALIASQLAELDAP